MDMTIALKSLNEMQQAASMRLIIIQQLTVIYVTYCSYSVNIKLFLIFTHQY